MLETTGNSITFYAFFVSAKQGKTGLTVTVDVRDQSWSEVVTAGSATEVGDGFYRYTLSSSEVDTEGEYLCVFKTTDTTVDQQHIPSLWVINKAGTEFLTGNAYTRLGAPAGASVSADIAAVKSETASILDDTGTSGVVVAAGSKTGYSLTQSFPTNFADLAITASTGRVTVGTNADKTGYSLTQTFPTNFADLAITATTGRVTAGTVSDKTGYSLTQSFPSNFASLAITAGGEVSLDLDQTGLSPRAMDAIGDGSLTVGDALVCAICAAAGEETVTGTSYVVKTPSTATTVRTFTLDDEDSPTSRT